MGGSLAHPLPSPLPLPLKKAKFFIYSAIWLKFGTAQFYMCTNNNLDYNLEMGFPFPSPPLHLKKVKLFIYSAILLEFEAQHLHMFTNNTL